MFKNLIILSLAVWVSSSAFADSSANQCPRSINCKCAPNVSQEDCEKRGGGPQIKVGNLKPHCVCKYH